MAYHAKMYFNAYLNGKVPAELADHSARSGAFLLPWK